LSKKFPNGKATAYSSHLFETLILEDNRNLAWCLKICWKTSKCSTPNHPDNSNAVTYAV